MKIISKKTVLLLAIFGFMATQTISAQTISCAQAYYPSQDTKVFYLTNEHHHEFGHASDSNYAHGVHLSAQIWTWDGYPGMEHAYLDFDLPRTQPSVSNVNLYLYNPYTDHPYTNHSSNASSPPNQLVFNRIMEAWNEKTLTWNNQPAIFESPSFVSNVISGTTDEPRYDDLVFNLNNIYIEDGKLAYDFYGVSFRCFQESISSYYRKACFASSRHSDTASWPHLNVEYQFPSPVIKRTVPNRFTLEHSDDITELFDKIEYLWTINGRSYEGQSVVVNPEDRYNIRVTMSIINMLGEVCSFDFSETYVGIEEQERVFSIYPNPANNILNVECDANIKISHYKIFSVNGALIREAAFTETGINISELPAGNYLLQLFDDTSEKRAFSFVKQ